ncbi:MAG TPA: hypothetical protein VFI96_02710, partial [Longimicrobiaceae bacterium]|nr:hypothetical protein [Longimicrobiaceae bacterium]
HVLTAHWFVVLRRLTESIAATLPLFAILFLPLLLRPSELYPWLRPLGGLAPELRHAVERKLVYLSLPFFLVRAAIYFATWLLIAELLRRWSLRQDQQPAPEVVHRQRVMSAGGLPVLAFTLTFASFDWLMSLSPWWYSTVYGIYYFTTGFLGLLALLAPVAYLAEKRGALPAEHAAEHYHALGNLTLTFVVFWLYIAFSQLLVIWIGNEPAEITWLYPRLKSSWAALGALLAVGLFAVPFLLLLWRSFKRTPRRLAWLGVWLVLMVYLDVFWLVIPELYPAGLHASWTDLAALAFVAGAMLAFAAWRQGGHPLVARHDPQMEESLEYEGGWVKG